MSGDWLVRPIATFLNSYPTELAVSLAVVGLSALILALQAYFAKLRPHAAQAVTQVPTQMPAKAKLTAAQVSGVQVRARSTPVGLAELQARAAEQIDAAEHALNRLLAECAGIANLPVGPTLTPERQLKAEAPAPARESLAA
jgi:predicted PurR-regulated permease PerM